MWALLAALAWAGPVHAEYDEGLTLRTDDGNWKAKVELRGQFRATYAAIPGDKAFQFQISRARIRLGGHAYRPWLKYYFEMDLVTPRILDLRLTVGPKWGHVQVGQWKAELGRERRASSREQQLVDRSIVNEWFTIDRQVGVSVMGHLFEDTHGDLRYALGAFGGHGARTVPDEPSPMLAGRLQWNFLGQDVKLAEGDLAFHERPAAAFAVGGVHNRSPYTRFSSSGGGQLPGYVDGDYTVNQGMVELDFQYMGISFQTEAHLKSIHDHATDDDALLGGVYAQAGWMPGGLVSPIPRQLELAYRFAVVDPDLQDSDELLTEHTAGIGWYFAGHRNKIQTDATWLDARDGDTHEPGFRTRLQWEISL